MGKLNFGEEGSRDSSRKRFRPENLSKVYKTVARIVSGTLKQEGTLRSLVYEHATTLVKTHLNLSIEVIRHQRLLEKLLTQTGITEKEDLDPELAQVLVYELLLGDSTQLEKGVEIFDLIRTYRDPLEAILKEVRDSGEFDRLVLAKPEATIPRYGRVNTLLTTLESVIESLLKNGYKQLDTEGYTYEEFLECVRSLGDREFVSDFHFPQDLLVFNPRQYLGKLFIHRAGHLVIHDKTSYFPVACLDAPPGSTVLDACAAPGMKTIHIASKMKNEGTLLALDMNVAALENLEENLNMFGVQCCNATITNYLSVDPTSKPFNLVEYILLDVPCSHSGNSSTYQEVVLGLERKYTPERLKPLCSLQFKMLSLAMKFPNVKRIVYTTASIDVHENERVVKDALRRNPGLFKVVKGLPNWHLRGKSEFDFGNACIRTLPIEDLTLGSFVAVLERIEGGPERVQSLEAESGDFVTEGKRGDMLRLEKKRVEKESKRNDGEDDDVEMSARGPVKHKKIKGRKNNTNASDLEAFDIQMEEADVATTKKSRKKSFIGDVDETERDLVSSAAKKERRKKRSESEFAQEDETEMVNLVSSVTKKEKRKKRKSESSFLCAENEDNLDHTESNIEKTKMKRSKLEVDKNVGDEENQADNSSMQEKKNKKHASNYDVPFDIFSPRTKR